MLGKKGDIVKDRNRKRKIERRRREGAGEEETGGKEDKRRNKGWDLVVVDNMEGRERKGSKGKRKGKGRKGGEREEDSKGRRPRKIIKATMEGRVWENCTCGAC